MCDHCKTYKPLLDGTERFVERPPVPMMHNAPPMPNPVYNANEAGCCSWRESCCNGGCCDQMNNCCGGESQLQPQPQILNKPATGYGYGFGYGQAPMGPIEVSTEKVPCVQREKKVAMCFGGDCKDTEECEDDASKSPKQSEQLKEQP